MGLPDVQDDGQFQPPRQIKLSGEHLTLLCARRKIVVIIQTALSQGDGLGMRYQSGFQRSQPIASNFRRVMRVDAQGQKNLRVIARHLGRGNVILRMRTNGNNAAPRRPRAGASTASRLSIRSGFVRWQCESISMVEFLASLYDSRLRATHAKA